MLGFWEEGTLRIIQVAEQEASPPEKLARVMQATFHPSKLDVALRAQALQDETVRAHQQRLAYLEVLAKASTDDRLELLHFCRRSELGKGIIT